MFYIFQFGTDLENATNLVLLPQYFDLEEYGHRRLGKVSIFTLFPFYLFTVLYCFKLAILVIISCY